MTVLQNKLKQTAMWDLATQKSILKYFFSKIFIS